MDFVIYWQIFICVLSFGIEYIPQELLNKIKGKWIAHNIFRIQGNKSIVCRLHCIAFIEYRLAGKTLLAYTNFLSPNDYKMNGKIIYKYFKDKCSGTIKSRL